MKMIRIYLFRILKISQRLAETQKYLLKKRGVGGRGVNLSKGSELCGLLNCLIPILFSPIKQ